MPPNKHERGKLISAPWKIEMPYFSPLILLGFMSTPQNGLFHKRRRKLHFFRFRSEKLPGSACAPPTQILSVTEFLRDTYEGLLIVSLHCIPRAFFHDKTWWLRQKWNLESSMFTGIWWHLMKCENTGKTPLLIFSPLLYRLSYPAISLSVQGDITPAMRRVASPFA